MAENTPKTGFPNAEKHNQEVATKLIGQDLINPPAELEAASSALDKLAETHTKEAEGREAPPKIEPVNSTPPDPAKVEADAKAKEAADKATADAKAKADADHAAAAERYFKDSPVLPPGASPKSSEAFSSIKIKAAQEISARESELEKLRKEKAALEEKLKNPVPPELAKELEEHRTWRAKLDVDADPKFKEFDKTVASAQEFIYAQLQKNPSVTKDTIEQIKKYGGPEMVNLSKIFETVKDPVMQRIVESKVADIEMAKFQKSQAIQLAKDNVQQYTTERAKAYQAAVGQHTTHTQARLEPMLKQLDWMAEKPIDEKMDAVAKKEAADHNAFVATTKQQLADALQDDSAEMRAILLAGMAQLFNIQRQVPGLKAELETKTKALAELQEKWDKVKNSSVSRLRESGASTRGTPAVKPADQFNTRAADALDTIAKQVMEQREAAKA